MDEFDLPELYDAANTWGKDDDFYLSLTKFRSGPVLDLGCGTGRLTRAVARLGFGVVGVDRSLPMLRHARQNRSKHAIDWVRADIRAFAFNRRFSLILMTSHVWQFLLTDDDQRACLERVREHLDADGWFAFETRAQPLGVEFGARHTKRFRDASGRTWSLEASSQFDADTSIDSSVLTYTAIGRGDRTTVRNRLRFTPVTRLDERLRSAGLRAVERYGNWDRTQYDERSPEIITIAARS